MKIDKVMEKYKNISKRNIYYKYDGHGGYQDPDLGWEKGSTCFSTVCSDDTRTLAKIGYPREQTRQEWNRMVRMVKRVSSGVRDCLRENPPSFEENTMMFASGNGYCDYFAFVLWRMYYFTPRMFLLIEYLHYHHKYKLHDAYILASMFKPKVFGEDRDYTIINKIRHCQIPKGLATKFKNASRLTNMGNYSMQRILRKGLKGNMDYVEKTWCKKNINDKKYMDTIVAFINS